MQSIRRSKKKKVVTLPKNIQELAQDKLHEISIFAQDKFQDQSQMLSLEQRIQADTHHKDLTMDQEIQQIIRNKRKTLNYYRLKRERKYSEDNKDAPHFFTGNAQLLILNKLQSNSVFVGFKSQKETSNHQASQKTQYLLLEKRKRMNTCPTPQSWETQMQISSEKRFISNEGRDKLRVGYRQDFRRKSNMSRSMDWKIRHKSKQNLDLFRKKIVNTFYPHQID